MGTRNVAAFASESKDEINALRDCIEACLGHCPNGGLAPIDDLIDWKASFNRKGR